MKSRHLLPLPVLLLLSACSVHPTESNISSPLTLTSPNGTLQLQTTQNGQLSYHLSLNNHPIIEDSPFSFSLDNQDLIPNARITHAENYAIDDSYPTRAVHATATDRCNGLKLDLASSSGQHFQLDLRAYDSGIAFRFIIPTSGPHTPDESTAFTFPANATAWVQSVRGHYEDVPMKTLIENLKPNQFAAPPLTVQLPDHTGYASITEAAVYHYPGSALQAAGDRTFALRLAPRVTPSYPFTLRYGDEGAKRITTPVPIDGTITTPWRVILAGPDLNTLVNSDILTNLNPPPDPTLFPNGGGGQANDWITPGRAVWNYLDGGRDSSPQGAKEFAQLGSLLGFKHNVIEGYWSRWSDDELRDVCAYSKARGVDVWVWMTSDPVHEVRRNQNTPATRPATSRPAPVTPETPGGPGLEPWPAARNPRPEPATQRAQRGPNPRFNIRDPETRRKLFAHLHDLGVSGLKIDFIDTEAQEAEEFYEGTLADAVQAHLMINFHGSAKPTGEQRTFPNELTREAVFGMEHRAYPPGVSAASTHTILPFCRFLAGSADYTPAIFGPRRYNTTWTHQLATAIVFTSAIQTFSAHPGNLLQLPPQAQDIIRTMPATWDQTIVLPASEIGECAAYARRSGDTWYLAIVNGEQPRDVSISFSFLADGQYKSDTLNDLPDNNASLRANTMVVKRSDGVTLHLGVGGGFVARFTRQ